MITGTLPFDASSSQSLYKKICAGQYITPSSISTELADLLACILVVDPNKLSSKATILWAKLQTNINFNNRD